MGLLDSWDDANILTKDGIFNTTQLNELKKWQKFAYEKDNNLFPYILGKDNDAKELSHNSLDKSVFILERILKIITTGNEDGKLIFEVENLS